MVNFDEFWGVSGSLQGSSFNSKGLDFSVCVEPLVAMISEWFMIELLVCGYLVLCVMRDTFRILVAIFSMCCGPAPKAPASNTQRTLSEKSACSRLPDLVASEIQYVYQVTSAHKACIDEKHIDCFVFLFVLFE